MKYLGSKARIAKYILPIMQKDRENKAWVEPFVGGANMIDKVDGIRIGADNNLYLIALLKKMKEDCNPDDFETNFSKEYADYVKKHRYEFPAWFVGWIGFGICGWGGKFFGGYQRPYKHKDGKIRYPILEYKNSILKQAEKLKDITFICADYRSLAIPKNSLIYCDPPYRNTTGYNKTKFDSDVFYKWCVEKGKEGHTVYVSEKGAAPKEFELVWSKEIRNNLHNSNHMKSVMQEKLYKYKGE